MVAAVSVRLPCGHMLEIGWTVRVGDIVNPRKVGKALKDMSRAAVGMTHSPCEQCRGRTH